MLPAALKGTGAPQLAEGGRQSGSLPLPLRPSAAATLDAAPTHLRVQGRPCDSHHQLIAAGIQGPNPAGRETAQFGKEEVADQQGGGFQHDAVLGRSKGGNRAEEG